MRVLLRLLAALLGLAIAAAGLLTAVEVGWAWGRPRHRYLLFDWPYWVGRLRTLDWAGQQLHVVAWSVAAGGFVLVLIALFARRSPVVRLNDPNPDVTVVTTPRSLARLVGSAVRAEDGVAGTSVSATARRVRVRARSRLNTEDQLLDRLVETAASAVGNLPLPRKPKVSVVVDSPKDRS
ncbi:MAG TPA: DUF6286 domain-containing protein [Pseudonocardiaceae bacterium]|nr:DUF6286 domain-containing protein [Pseudonocardiaceae bacterium]